MNRRDFITSSALAGGGLALAALSPTGILGEESGLPIAFPGNTNFSRSQHGGVVTQLAGLGLPEFREKYRAELMDEYIPFLNRFAVDHERGGFMMFLDHDGTPENTNKFHWFQGRGVYIYSFIYNHLKKDEKLLDVAKKTTDFILRHYPQDNGWWAQEVDREGNVLVPFQGDPFGTYFAIEGMQELAAATGDRELLRQTVELFEAHFNRVHSPDFTFRIDLSNVHEPGRGLHGVNTYMVDLQIATEMLRRWDLPQVEVFAQKAVDAMMNHYYNAELGIMNEFAFFDFTKRPEDETKSNLGHGIEIMWIVMEEAIRRRDQELYDTAKQRMRYHLDLAWDHVYGGIAEWINIGHGCYEWPSVSPRGTNFTYQGIGEYKYIKPLWGLNEANVGLLNVLEHTGEFWALDYFNMSQRVIDEKFSLRRHGYPLHIMFADRQITFVPKVGRKPNYHHPRMLAKGILALDRMIERGGRPRGSIA